MSPQESEKKENNQQPDDTGAAPSEIEVLKQKMADLEAENKKIKEEKLDARTDPNYIRKITEDRRKAREAKILNQRLPRGRQLTDAQLEDMTTRDILSYVDQKLAEGVQHIQNEKINPMYEQNQDDKLQSGLKQLNEVDKDWVNYQEDMLPIAQANQNMAPIDVYLAALAAKKDWKKLDAVREKLNPKPKEEKKVTDSNKKEVSTGGRPQVTGGEKPSTSVTSIKTPTKPMSNKEAAAKAYDDLMAAQGNL